MEEAVAGARRSRERSVSVESSASSPDDQGKSSRTDYFPAEKLFEYQWPLGEENAEFYMLQEQVMEFLDIRGIQRKYPDLSRRNLELRERKYLMSRGIVTETQSNMGLVALQSEEVLELMAEDYPLKCEEYQAVLQEREFQATLRKKTMEAKKVAQLSESQVTGRSSHVMDEAMRSVVRFNSRLAEARRTARKEYRDTQTELTHIPRHPQAVCPAPRLPRYPVALLPGQYVDHVPHYTSDELNRLPLKTVLEAPELKQMTATDTSANVEETSTSILKSLFAMTGSNSTPRSSAPNTTLSSSILSAILAKARMAQKAAKDASPKPPPVLQRVSSAELPRVPVITNAGRISSSLTAGGNSASVSVGGGKIDGAVSIGNSEVAISNRVVAKSDGAVAMGDGAVAVSDDVVSIGTKRVATNDQKADVGGDGVATGAKEGEDKSGSEDKTSIAIAGSSGAEDPDGAPPAKRRKLVKPGLCPVCYKGPSSNQFGQPEQMLSCSSCRASVHPSCYGLDKKALTLLRGCGWQCLECKSCQLCSDSGQDEAMMCCDQCDRGYHYFCVGLEGIPEGQWQCKPCTSCACCGKDSPGPDHNHGGIPGSWRHEYYKGKLLLNLCLECSGYFRRGYFCPICLRVYHDDETDSPMVCCDQCDRWIHIECDDISEERYKELSKEDKSVYICALCRGEKQEKMDKFHKKNFK